MRYGCVLGTACALLRLTVSADDFSVLDFGAMAGADVDNAPAFQRAVDACAASGGGRVTVPAGVFKTYTFGLKSNVELHLAPGAEVLGGEDGVRYEPFQKTTLWHVERAPRCPRALVYTSGQTNVAITGAGVIDGNAARFHERVDGRWRRVSDTDITARCVMFACCRNVRLSDATIRNASGWSTFFLDCDDVDVRRVRIRCDRNLPNCDGLHFGACRDVAVEDCDVDAADDAIVVRNHQELTAGPHRCERIAFSNCVLRSNQAAVRIGWHGDGPIRDLSFDHILCDYSRVGIQFVLPPMRPVEGDPPRGTGIATPPLSERLPFSVENVRFSDFSIVSHYAPVSVKIGKSERVNFIRNITFERGAFHAHRQPVFDCRPEDGVSGWRFTDVSFDIEKPRAPVPTRSDYGVSGGERTFLENMTDVVLENVRWRSTTRNVPEWYIVMSQDESDVPIVVEGAWQDFCETRLADGTRRLRASALSDGQTTWDVCVTIDEWKECGGRRYAVTVDNRDQGLVVKELEGPYSERIHVDAADMRLSVGNGDAVSTLSEIPEQMADTFRPGALLETRNVELASEGKTLECAVSSPDATIRLRYDARDGFAVLAPVWRGLRVKCGETHACSGIRFLSQIEE